MKYITVEEYAKKEGICLAAAYKRTNAPKWQHIIERKFGRILIKIKA